MTRLEFCESGQALAAARIGFVPVDLLTRYDFYKTYTDLVKAGMPEDKAKKEAALLCKCDRSTIARAIYWFERPDDWYSRSGKGKGLQVLAQGL